MKARELVRNALDRVRSSQWVSGRYDRSRGIDTAGWCEMTDLTIAAGDASLGTAYAGTPPRLARWWLAAMPSDPSNYTFVDMGSGKGRVLVMAAEHGFGRVLGVEFGEELHSVALENARVLERRGIAIEPILGDAGAFEFPDDGPLVVHFNNPFTEPVMRRVIGNLSASYERAPRPMILVYQQMKSEPPEHRTQNIALLEDVPFLRLSWLPEPKRLLDRRMLAAFQVALFESPEVRDSP